MAKLSITDPIYHDNDAARAHLEGLLWPHGPSCPRCGVLGDRITKLQGKSTRPGVYKCKDCRKPFSVTVGTVMERSHIPLCKWVLAAQLLVSSKKGFSAHELHRILGTNYETAWFLFHRLREAAERSVNTLAPSAARTRLWRWMRPTSAAKRKKSTPASANTPGAGRRWQDACGLARGRAWRRRPAAIYVANVTAATLRPDHSRNIGGPCQQT